MTRCHYTTTELRAAKQGLATGSDIMSLRHDIVTMSAATTAGKKN
jgi:hypothetical protein